ncbi:MAG: leucine-rich repeat domain-containing protein [Saprospiraceae bacterium]|nr:leucine-rich repeat domain-containing protein [Saprospiraceae bacterium]
MRLLVILTLTITTFAYGWIHLQIKVSPYASSTKNRSVVSKEANQLTEVQKLSLEKLNFVCDRRSDSLELVKFYNATGGQNWIHKWDLNKSLDSWYGIGLNNAGCVKYIDMDGKPNGIKDSFLTNNLTGLLISLDLNQLEGLIVPNNKISGSIPEFLNLPNLTTLVLEANQFNGEIPVFLNLQNLKFLWLNDNKLTGNIINFNLPALQELNLSRNLLTGTIPNFDKIPNLYWLFLNENQLTGTIPDFIKLPYLSTLWLYSNQLSGTIPNFNHPNLYGILLGNNNLTGPIPNFDKVGSLQDLNLSGNKLSGNIPVFNKVPFLKYLLIADNDLYGVIPDHTTTNIHLDLYYLNNNRLTFSGIIPNLEKVKTLTNITNKECPTCTYDTLIYTPQQKIYHDTTILISPNTSYTLDLLIDDTVTTNTYTWYKNGTLYKTIKGSNKLPFTPFTNADEATYTVKITNPLASQLTLESWPIRLNAGPSLVCDRWSDSLELVKFYNATGGPNWWKKWDLSKPMDSWWGVTLNTGGCVNTIILYDTSNTNCMACLGSGNNLIGPIPSINLSQLSTLNLSNNKISGSIPNFNLPQLSSLILLYDNLFGTIPNFDKLPNLDFLYLIGNQLEGPIPNFDKIQNLHVLVLNDNKITGTIPNFNKLPNLQVLSFSDNHFTGSIPNFDKSLKLISIVLSNNKLSGTIPNFGPLQNLQSIGLQNNQLTGQIPNLDELKDVIGINFSQNQLSGPIPEYNTLSKLRSLILSFNSLTGSIPSFKLNPELELIQINNNQLTGNLPKFVNNKFLFRIWLHNNNLSGTLPNYNLDNPKLSYLTTQENKVTFSGLLSNLASIKNLTDLINRDCPTCLYDTLIYAPQKKIYSDTTILIPSNTPYTIDLLIDDTVTTSTYTWYKNGALYKTIKGSNKLAFTPFTTTDAGTYTVKITNPLAPQLTLESWPIRLNALPMLICDRRSDSLELVKFYNETGGPNWWKKWDLSKPISTWWGITINNEGCVTEIRLNDTAINGCCSGNNLIGTLIIIKLPSLTYINLRANNLSGTIPDFHFPSLENLRLETNKLSGSIPNFKNLPKLGYLALEGNQLTGDIPNFDMMPLLYRLGCYDNQLTGPVPNLNNLPQLNRIHLNDNKLTGSIPSFDNNPKLETINLYDNELTGSIPDFKNLPLLKVLALHHNFLSGSLPGLKGCLLLENYEVHNNRMGGMIQDLSHLKNLGTLTLSDNNFSGPLPKLDKFPGLKEVWLANNSFTGSLEDYTISNPLLRRGTFEGNKLTFTNIIKYHDKIKTLIEVTNKWSQSLFTYAPQDTIYRDTTIFINNNTPYTLDLLIDDTVTTSTYAWYKNGSLYKTMKGNKLPFNPFTNNDAGTYTVKITNPLAPQLTLESWPIRLKTNAASDEQDCSNARVITITPCYQKFIIDSMIGPGSVLDEADNSCLDFNNFDLKNNQSESNSKWFKWTANENLNITFTITPLISNEDIDFAVFELPDGINGCATKRLIRCNATTCNLSSTGLNESSTDIEESPNCDPGEDGFLKSLDMVKGKTYAIMVNGFEKQNAFSIEFMLKIIALKPDYVKVKHSTPTLFDVLANDTISKGASIDVMIQEPQNGTMIYSRTSGRGTYTSNPKFSGKEILKYTVCSTICPTDCKSSTIEFEVESPCSDRNSLVLPNVIFPDSPSRDNRYFIVEALIDCPDAFGPKPTKLTVYNRWGDLVYRNDDYKNDWDGTNTQGQPLPTGTYYYLLDLGSVSAPIKGYVVIMR